MPLPKPSRYVVLLSAALLSSSVLALENADFFELRAEYADRQALSGWVPILTDGGPRPDAHVVVKAVDFAYDGNPGAGGTRGNVAYFDTLANGFGVNKLDQCVAFDRGQPLSIGLRLRTNADPSADAPTESLAVRVNPNFYANLAACEADLAANVTSGRLSGTNHNLDLDVIFTTAGVVGNSWHEPTPFHYEAGQTPNGAAAVRISLRARDRADVPSPDRRIYFGPVMLENGAAPSQLINGDFSIVPIARNQRLVQDGTDSGWLVHDNTAAGLTVEQQPFAESGPNVIRFANFTNGYGATRIDQCVELAANRDLGVAVKVRSPEPHPELAVRVNVQPMSDATCSTDAGDDIEHNFPVDGTPNTWQWLETPATAWSDLHSAATHARVSVRARDRSDGGDPSTSPARTIYIDQVFLQSMIELSLTPGTYDFPQDVGLTGPLPDGLIARYTLDGSSPTDGSPLLTDDIRLASNGEIVLSVRLFDADGRPASGVSRARYTMNIAGAPTFSGLTTTALSGVVDDPTDPAASSGLSFSITGSGSLTLATSSSNPSVVPNSGLQVTGNDSNLTLTITPTAVGYATITLTVTDGDGLQAMHTIQYAASAHADPDITHTRWYTGRADLSTAVSLDENFIMVFDDEGDYERSPALRNGVLVYDFSGSGAPVADLSTLVDAELNVANSDNCELADLTGVYEDECSTDGEVDYEAAMRIGDRIYVTGSHSNNRNGRGRPDRWRFFAANVAGSGAGTTLDVQGYYQWLREDLRTWDADNEHSFGANHFGLVASSNSGVAATDPDLNQAPESPNLNGFSIEGLTVSPDDSAAWFGFRAPLVAGPGGGPLSNDSAAGRTHALIIAVTNYDALATATDGGSIGTANFGMPLRLDLGGRGIREMRRDDHGHYLIIAGPSDSATGTAPKDFRLFMWDGSHDTDGFATNLVERAESLASFSPSHFAGSPEGIAALPSDLLAGGDIEFVSDNGDVDFYNDGTVAKDLAYNEHKKFRIDRLTLEATLHVVNGSASPAAGGQVVCAATSVSHGASTSCTATPYFGYELSSWSGCTTSAGNLCEIDAVMGSLTASATFTPSATSGLVLPEGPQAGQALGLELVGAGIDNNWIIAEAAAESAASPPAGLSLPHGLVSLRLVNGTPGSAATVTLTYPQDLPSGTRFYKYGSTTGGPAQWYEFSGATISGNTITLTLVDGGAGDHDGEINGVIEDPGAPAVPLGGGVSDATDVKPIPVMSPWAMLLLVLALMGVATRMRQRG